MKWYVGILEDLRKECECDCNVTLEDAVYNHKLSAEHE